MLHCSMMCAASRFEAARLATALASLALAALHSGCSGGSADAPEPVSEPPPASTQATYHVPVSPELEAYSSFELDDLRFRARGSEWSLDYSLPVLLVGSSQRVSFRGSLSENGEYQLSGDAGQVTCQGDSQAIRCDEVLSAVPLDAQKLERALAAFPDAEAAARRAVAAHFSDDPIGVLTFPR